MSAANTSLACIDTAVLIRLTRKPTPVRAATATVKASIRTPSSPERHSRASMRRLKDRAWETRMRGVSRAWVAICSIASSGMRSDDAARLHRDDPAAPRGQLAIVSHQYQCCEGIRVQLEQQLTNAPARSGV